MSGFLSVTQKETKFEWTLNNFLQHYDVVSSPEFQFSDVTWMISITIDDYKCSEEEHVSLRLKQMSSKDFAVNVTVSFKTVNGKNDSETTCTEVINKENMEFYKHNFILKSDLIRRKSELLPSDVLTVICTLKRHEPSVDSELAKMEKKTGVWNLQKHLREIYLSGDACDVILKVEDQEFKSHRSILAARSPIFSGILQNKMKENITEVVVIKDGDPETFPDFLHYLYTGSTIDLKTEKAVKLYKVACNYQVEELRENCLDCMLVNVSIENFCDIYLLSVQYNEELLNDTCIVFFGKHLLDIIQTFEWQSFLCEHTRTANELHIMHVQSNYDFYKMLSKR